MARRCMAAGMREAAKQFRRVNGHLHLPGSGPRSMRTQPKRQSDQI
jgi:hypothetical protein